VSGMQRIGNWFVRTVLRSPLHGMMSRFLMLLTYTGRRSGTEYTIPLGYHQQGRAVTVLVGRAGDKVWWRNFDGGGAPVTLRLRGEAVAGTARVVDGRPARDAMEAYFRGQPRSAKAFGVEERSGVIDPEALDEALERIPVVRIDLA